MSSYAGLQKILRRCHDAATRVNMATLFLMHEARDRPSREQRWLIGYEADLLLQKILADAESLAGLLNDDASDEAEYAAKAIYGALKARRLAAALENVVGRTAEEAEAFKAKAKHLRVAR